MKEKEKLTIFTKQQLQNLPKKKLVRIILGLYADAQVKDRLLTQLHSEHHKQKIQKVNLEANKPSSKQPEWNKDTGKENKKLKRKKKNKARKGAGNRTKPEPAVTNHNPLENCPFCNLNLNNRKVIEETKRIVEDVLEPPEKTVVSEEIQEKKWCPNCKRVVNSVSPKALAKSDIGLNGIVLMAYLWVVTALSLPSIKRYVGSFSKLNMSTSGISKLMLRLGNILNPIYEEILDDVKGGTVIFADETGWRVKGVLHWLWIFANKRSAYYWIEKSRGNQVVERVLGNVFSGVLVTDAWHAYRKIICLKQTCMAHIFRKVRKFKEQYPQYYSLLLFYNGLKRIIKQGERLRGKRAEIGEEAFQRRLKALKKRLDELLSWKNPNHILKTVIKKVHRQSAFILTFVEYNQVPTHNNYGEYIIKKGILKRKISGGSMSQEGATAYACLQSIAQTCYLRGISFRKFLFKSLSHYIKTGKPMLLSAYELEENMDKDYRIAA